MDTNELQDCIVVGAGPAGLSAALYLARFQRRVRVLHDGTSRALRIPHTRNAPGFPDAIGGPDLVTRMLQHCQRYGADVRLAEVLDATRDGDVFVLNAADGTRHIGRALVLATGTRMHEVDLPRAVHEAAIQAGVLRYCPVCDAIEHAGTRIGVLGSGRHGAAEALFLRHFSAQVTLVACEAATLEADAHARLSAAGVRVLAAPAARFAPSASGFDIYVEGHAMPHTFDVVYAALGARQRTELAAMLGVACNADGCVDAGAPFGTSVPGVFCAGDIVEGLDQISVAMGHGAIAATRAHNWLRACDGQTMD